MAVLQPRCAHACTDGTALPCADRSSKCPFGILLQHHCPLPAQLREGQQRRRREQQTLEAATLMAAPPVPADGSPEAAAAAPTAVAAQLPSQAALLQRVRRRRMGAPGEQEPAVGASIDALMDELYHLEQRSGNGQQAEQAGQPAIEAGQTERHGALPQTGRGQATASIHPVQAAVTASGAEDASARPPRQRSAAPGAAAAGAQLGSPAGCFVAHSRVVAFVWAVVRSAVPAQLLGDARCQRVLRQAVR